MSETSGERIENLADAFAHGEEARLSSRIDYARLVLNGGSDDPVIIPGDNVEPLGTIMVIPSEPDTDMASGKLIVNSFEPYTNSPDELDGFIKSIPDLRISRELQDEDYKKHLDYRSKAMIGHGDSRDALAEHLSEVCLREQVPMICVSDYRIIKGAFSGEKRTVFYWPKALGPGRLLANLQLIFEDIRKNGESVENLD